uniref:Secreted protein n=1 Tax=Bursaphelenchus xylophilus TaxID=6326 RepID=A0A1I7RTR4_BURXY
MKALGLIVLGCVVIAVYGSSKSLSNFGQTRMSNGKTEHQKCQGDGTTITECDGTTHPGLKASAESCRTWCGGETDFDFADSDKAKNSRGRAQSSFSSSRTKDGVSQHQKCAGDGSTITECDGTQHPGGRATSANCHVWCDGSADL